MTRTSSLSAAQDRENLSSYFGGYHHGHNPQVRAVGGGETTARRLGSFVQKRKFVFSLKDSRGALDDRKMARRRCHEQVGRIPRPPGI